MTVDNLTIVQYNQGELPFPVAVEEQDNLDYREPTDTDDRLLATWLGDFSDPGEETLEHYFYE